MTYATLQDLIDRYGEDELIQLSDRAEPPAGAIDPAIVSKALTDATELVDGYVAGRYRVPLSPVPGMIQRLVCDIARFFLHDDRSTEAVKDAYQAALKALRDISAGVITLQAAGIQAASGETSSVVMTAPGRVFKTVRRW